MIFQQYTTAIRLSLAFVWLFTAFTSTLFAPQIGFNLLRNAGITDIAANFCVYGGSLLDVIIGLWLLTPFATALCCIVQALVILTFTVLLSYIDASFWLHPFGPLTKNIPMLMLIFLLYKQSL